MNSGRCRTVFSSSAIVTSASARRRCSSDWCRLWVSSRAIATCAARARARRTSSSLIGPGLDAVEHAEHPQHIAVRTEQGNGEQLPDLESAYELQVRARSFGGVFAEKTHFFASGCGSRRPSWSGISTGASYAVLHSPANVERGLFQQSDEAALEARGKLAARTTEVCMNSSSFPAEPSSKEISRISCSSWA